MGREYKYNFKKRRSSLNETNCKVKFQLLFTKQTLYSHNMSSSNKSTGEGLASKPTAAPPSNSGLPSFIQTGPANLGEIGIATIFGVTAGFATKRISKGAAMAVGVGFIGLQALARADLIKINWPRVEGFLIGKADVDGDGKFTGKDIQIGATRLIHNLSGDLPSAAGFAAAFYLGFRYG
ncbi:hypothetical protein BASA50_000383 [Batrachochytrium salamandrivorans]|uniref:FUN14 domain-containing protein n=1 Tax=Batrachochytrium salamandrivorans TaxID=1357716 RepID=A0ABQ8EWS3_9FUNG|nr:hypothetical protein BASA60_000694 [Batrachochytrium salamandrivorans]KAH6586671.1 hypothetical protein BASA50_000383 [Batrachochytrium salamandrivorans]